MLGARAGADRPGSEARTEGDDPTPGGWLGSHSVPLSPYGGWGVRIGRRVVLDGAEPHRMFPMGLIRPSRISTDTLRLGRRRGIAVGAPASRSTHDEECV